MQMLLIRAIRLGALSMKLFPELGLQDQVIVIIPREHHDFAIMEKKINL